MQKSILQVANVQILGHIKIRNLFLCILYIDIIELMFYNAIKEFRSGLCRKELKLIDYEKELLELLSSCGAEEKQSIADMIRAILENYE